MTLNLVPFVSVENMMRLVLERGVETCMEEIAGYIEEDFRRWPLFDKTPRVASHSNEGVIELMPTSDGIDYGFKYVNGHPKNMKEGLQTVTAFGLLASVETGYPVLLSEMTVLTALRTAATSAVATKYLARSGSKVLALIGNGAQSEFQALALRRICGIETVRLYDIDPKATEKCAANLEGSGLRIISCGSPEEAIEGADVVTTCTADKQYATILTDNMVGAGLHINAIGGDCPGKTELHRDILLRADIYVEYPPQTRIEGDIQQLEDDHPVKELWQVLTGQEEGRADDRAITLFDGVGFAIEDFSALRWVRDALGNSERYLNLDMSPAVTSDQKRVLGHRLNQLLTCIAAHAGCRGRHLGHGGCKTFQGGGEVGRRAAVDGIARRRLAGHVLKRLANGDLHRVQRVMVFRLTFQMRVHGQHARMFAGTIVVILARQIPAFDQVGMGFGVVWLLRATSEITVGPAKDAQPVDHQFCVKCCRLVAGAGQCQLLRAQAEAIGRTAFHKRERLQHFAGGARQDGLGGVSPSLNHLAFGVGDHSMTTMDTFQKIAAPDFGKDGGFSHVGHRRLHPPQAPDAGL